MVSLKIKGSANVGIQDNNIKNKAQKSLQFFLALPSMVSFSQKCQSPFNIKYSVSD